MVTTLLLATCVATATSHLPELKKDFEDKACTEGVLKASLSSTKDLLEVIMTVDVDRAEIAPDPSHTVNAANTAQFVLGYVNKTFKYFPHSFKWSIHDENDKNVCTIKIVDGEVSGDCAGAGQK